MLKSSRAGRVVSGVNDGSWKRETANGERYCQVSSLQFQLSTGVELQVLGLVADPHAGEAIEAQTGEDERAGDEDRAVDARIDEDRENRSHHRPDCEHTHHRERQRAVPGELLWRLREWQ